MRFTTTIANLPKKRAFVLLRFTLIIAASYLFLAESGFASPPLSLVLVIAAALASNIVLLLLPRQLFDSMMLTAGIIVGDTAWITIVLFSLGRLDADFFYVYFFVLFLAAIGEDLRLIAVGTVVVSVGYLYALSTTSGTASIWTSSSLLRLPLLFSVAAFYGYLVQRVRRERRRRREEALTNAQLEDARSHLAERADELEQTSERLQREVAERRQAEADLERSNRRLEKLNRRKSDFISTVSHELRTPLASIKNASDLLGSGRAGELSETHNRFLEMISRNTKRLTGIINDLLDLSKIEAGRMEMEFSEVDLRELLDDLLQSLQGQADAKGVTLVMDCEPSVPRVWADPQRIEQVVSNLLSNALRFTAGSGQVALRAKVFDEEVEISVADTGIGLSEEEQSHIFDQFYQVEQGMTQETKGSGLGLSIVRRLLSSHGSVISVQSELGEGSCFRFRLATVSARAVEMSVLELALPQHHSDVGTFSIFVIRPARSSTAGNSLQEVDEVCLARIHKTVRAVLTRSHDRILAQPVLGQLVVLLDGTSKGGAEVVKEKLERVLMNASAENAVSPVVVLGPARFPEDGVSALEMVNKCRSSSLKLEDR